MEIEFLKKLIEFKTIYGNKDEFNNCFNYIKEYLKDSELVIKEYIFEENKSLVISNTDTKELDIIFCGHIDVVPANDDQFTPQLIENSLYGRGTFDMKGHDAVMIEIMKNIKKINTNYKVALFLTSDEERGGFLGTDKLLNKIGYRCKLAIVPDAGNNFNLIEEEKGVLQLEISYKGKPAHASQVWHGDNALVKLFNLYHLLIKRYPLPKNSDQYITSINLAKLKGGDVPNRVCDHASMILDIRHVYDDKKEDIINFIKEIEGINIKILAKGEEYRYLENDLSRKYLEIASKVLNKQIMFKKCEQSSDGRFFYNLGISCILMNAIGEDPHGLKENIDINSLQKMYEIYKLFLEN